MPPRSRQVPPSSPPPPHFRSGQNTNPFFAAAPCASSDGLGLRGRVARCIVPFHELVLCRWSGPAGGRCVCWLVWALGTAWSGLYVCTVAAVSVVNHFTKRLAARSAELVVGRRCFRITPENESIRLTLSTAAAFYRAWPWVSPCFAPLCPAYF